MRQLAEYKRKEARRELEEKKAKSSREGLREKQVHRDLKAADAKKKAVNDQLNRTSYHNQYGVQDHTKTSSQSVSQLVSQKGALPQQKGVSLAKAVLIQLAHPKITTQICKGPTVENPMDTRALRLILLPKSPVGCQTTRK